MTYFEPFKISINGLQGGVPYIPLKGTVLRETIRDPDSIGSCPATVVLLETRKLQNTNSHISPRYPMHVVFLSFPLSSHGFGKTMHEQHLGWSQEAFLGSYTASPNSFSRFMASRDNQNRSLNVGGHPYPNPSSSHTTPEDLFELLPSWIRPKEEGGRVHNRFWCSW